MSQIKWRHGMDWSSPWTASWRGCSCCVPRGERQSTFPGALAYISAIWSKMFTVYRLSSPNQFAVATSIRLTHISFAAKESVCS
ncbi:hypothetical protein ACVWZV_009338 [Bradyrhizobium sp. GM5.1]